MSTHRVPGEHAPEIAAGIGSAALSAVALVGRPLVNNDGVFYLLAAEAFARDGLDAARAAHAWPFYSVLVAGVAALLRVSTEAAAHLLDSVLIAAACVAFVAIVAALGGGRRTRWLAALVVLAHPWLNHSRALVVRDSGVWAFGLLALLMLLRYDRGRRATAAAGWAACSLAAVLFRPEAVILMAAGPLAVAADRARPLRERAAFLLGLAAALAVAARTAEALASQPVALFSTTALARSAETLAASFPTPYGREYSPFILALGLLAIPVVKTLKAAGLAHAALAAIGMPRAAPAGGFAWRALVLTLAAGVVPLYVQVVRLLFVESRYTVLATLVLSLWAPFGLAWLLRPDAGRAARTAVVLLGVALAASLALGPPLRHRGDGHVREAAAWVRANGRGARLHTNSLQVAYLSGAAVDWPLVRGAAINGALDGSVAEAGSLWAVRVPPGDAALRRRLDAMRLYRREAAFEGRDGDAVLVYTCTGAAGCIPGR